MNEIVPIHLDQKVTPKISGPSPALIVLLEGELAQKATTLVRRLENTVTQWDAWLNSMREVKQATTGSRRTNPFNPPSSDDVLQEAIASGETMLRDPLFQRLCIKLTPFIGTATVAQVKYEITKLLAAFPTKDDLIALTALMLEELISEQRPWLVLATACREVRRNSKFRPSIAEVLEALDEVEWHANQRARIVRLPKYVTALQKHLVEAKRLRPPEPTPLERALVGCGCLVSQDQDGYFVTDLERHFAGPFATETEAWSWLEEHAEALAAALAEQLLARKRPRRGG